MNNPSLQKTTDQKTDRTTTLDGRDSSQIVVTLDHVSFGYSHTKLILRDFSLTIRQGEILTLLGPSGCGKSTLLNLIAGFYKPLSGVVTHGDKLIKAPSSKRGVVFQGNALFDWMTVEQNIGFGFRFQKIPAAESRFRVKQIIDLVGLAGSEKKYPYQLSGGMRQRAAVARSMVVHPEVLLMDEPFAAVDVQTREGLQEELLKLHDQVSGAILFVTHSIEEAVFLSDRIIVLDRDCRGIFDEIKVHLPSPRWSAMNRISEDFNHYRIQLYLRLKELG
jgi:NitT/TauT family transport system ATP-binding protein